MWKFLTSKERKRREKAKRLMSEINTRKLKTTTLPGPEKYEIPGRRIVNLKTLSAGLSGCCCCSERLNLFDIEDEKIMGLGSILRIKCQHCGFINDVKTDTTHSAGGSRGPDVFTSNTKLVLGMIDSGTGTRQVNKLFAAIGIPGISHTTVKRRERELEPSFSHVAEKSCSEAIQEEIYLTKKATEGDTPETPASLAVKYDMCWQKRGSGRSYNSASGVGTVMGHRNGKVLSYDVCCTNCRFCEMAENNQKSPQEHNCSKNWFKSAKAMEAETGACLLKTIEDTSDARVSTLNMDGDAATLSRVKQILGHDVEKWSDINHMKKSVGNALFTLQKNYKALSTSVMRYFQRCFSYAVSQNKDNPENLRGTLLSIVPHAFDDHSCCGDWCRADDENHSHRSLPNGKCLTGDDFRSDLHSVFNTMANNVDKLAPGGSTKDVQSINNIYASKAPKRIHHSSSQNLRSRIAAGVSQKNLGYSYIGSVNSQASLSPNRISEKLSDKLRVERKRHLKYSEQPIVKRRKFMQKKEKSARVTSQEKKEGVTYQSDIGLTLSTEITTMPQITYKPKLEKITIKSTPNYICFDLETTSLKEDCDIVQIAAKSIESNCTFDTYVQPNKPMSSKASAVTGLSTDGGIVFLHGRPVRTCIPEVAFQKFVSWLEDQEPVVLVAHNAKNFDSRRLVHHFSKYTCFATFRKCVLGFADTLPLFRALFPSLTHHNQENVHRHIFQTEYKAHNAVDDVQSLAEILNETKFEHKCMDYSFTITSLLLLIEYDKVTNESLKTLNNLIVKKVMSSGIARKIAESGLTYSHLVLACSKGNNGIEELMKERRVDGSPRVTNCKKIISKLSDYLHA